MDFGTGDMLGVKTDSPDGDEQMYWYLHDTRSFVPKNCDFLEAVLMYGLEINKAR